MKKPHCNCLDWKSEFKNYRYNIVNIDTFKQFDTIQQQFHSNQDSNDK